MKKLIIDVSEFQGKINWSKVKPQIDGAILRCGYGSDYTSQDDKYFKRNADECTRLGIPFGVYLYSHAKSEAQAKSEAAHVLRLIKGYKLAYPVYYDLEEKGTESYAAKAAKIFCEIIEDAGYWCGVYANVSWWNDYLKDLNSRTKWVAQYYKECQYKGDHLDIWQYASDGKVDGITGNVDMNYCYRDLPAEILGAVPAVKSDEAKLGFYRCTSDLNLRTGPATDYKKLETMDKDSRVTCLGCYAMNGKTAWLLVASDSGKTGWCSSKYLEKL